jgi:hypothetical protein
MKTRPQQTQITPKKKLLVGLLLAIFCVVFWNNFLRGENKASRDTATVRPAKDRTGSHQISVISPDTDRHQPEVSEVLQGKLPSVELSKVISHNPFAAPFKKSKLVSTENAKQNDAWKKTNDGQDFASSQFVGSEAGGRLDPAPYLGRVTAIITGGNHPAALINDQVYFEKDLLDDAWKIQAIHEDRVVIVPHEED